MGESFKCAADVPLATREVLYAHDILRIVGVPSDDLFVTYEAFGDGSHDGNVGMFACVVKQGEITLPIFGVQTPMAEQEAVDSWAEAVNLWNRTCNDKSAGWDVFGSRAREQAVWMVVALDIAGIKYGWS